ncbi:polysaccharide biosynthesis tyrosine autokinase [Anabaena sp. UHCC 0187]|uniref:GumC family protein n=1 Tax=Anabaena sp. UHCC 0187 TaxID=2590018 RepID=UPI0014467585|nr:polysaccharide biosynthesis tyrosine autokinase [Anabaena sp. UHCC 0187]MTJ11429.1 polysaccharide biosynthesis tyrosine autokinase [Anabaena sp. UHCC 0187]
MLDKQIANHTNPNSNIIPSSRFFPHSTLSEFPEEGSDWNLRQFLSLLQRRAIIITGVVTVAMAGVTYSTLKQENIYQGNFQILVEPVNNDNDLGKINIGDTNISRANGLDYESQIQVLKSPELLQPVVKKLQESYPDITYTSLLEGLTIRRFGAAKVIEVSYKSNDTQKIQFVLDAISKFYLNYSLDKRQTKLRQGVQFVDKQLPEIQKRVTYFQKEMQIFRQRYNFIDPENQSQAISQEIQFLTQQRLSINQQLVAARANYLSLQGEEGQLAVINSAPLYQQLIVQQRQLDTQISGELTRFQPDNPVIQSLQEKRDNLLPIINKEAQRALNIKIAEAASLIRKAEVDSQQLIQAEQQLQKKLEQLPVLSRQYTDIQRSLQIANESLNRFLANREQLQIQVAQTELPWELIQAPTQREYPISPNITSSLLMGLVASSLLGIGAALLIEEMDNTYHTIESLKDKIRLPILGTLPFDKTVSHNPYLNPANKVSNAEIVATDIPQGRDQLSRIFRSQSSQNNYYGQGAFWESLQVLYSNLQLLNSDQPIRSLIISSSVPGDGKSTVSFHLAKIATAMGKKVLLVDADLRRPQIHRLSELNNLWGLSNLISSNMDVEQVMKEMPNMKDLSVITSGPIPPDPARLLSSDRMRQIMDYCHQSFDLVIYDAPPMLGLVDARLIAPHTDGVMLVVRMNKTDKSALAQVQDSLKTYPINVLGIVVNGDKSQTNRYNSYYGQSHQERVRNSSFT